MVWLVVVIAIVAIIVIVVVKSSKQKNEENKRIIRKCVNEMNEKWAICVTRFIYSENLEPCLIHVKENKGEKELVRISKGNTQEELLFKISEENTVGSGEYKWAGDDERGSYSLCTIDVATNSEKKEHASVECGLTLSYHRDVLCYIVLAFVDDAKDGVEIINNQ